MLDPTGALAAPSPSSPTGGATRGGRPGQPRTASGRRVLAGCTVILLAVTVLQRLALPLGSPVPVGMLVVLGVLGWLLLQRAVVERADATRGFLLAVAGCATAAVAALLLGELLSVQSLVLLLVVWCAFCFRAHPAAQHVYPRVLDRFEKIMVFFAVVGVAQVLSQFAGVWSYVDYVEEALPPGFTFEGYNTSYPIQYGSSVIKANAFVFLEPSLFSQFLALALLSCLVRRARPWRVLALAAAMVCAVAGTGMLLLACGLVVLAVRRGGWWTARVAAAGAVAVTATLATPLGEIILSRTSEATERNSSGSLRFVQPFQYIEATWAAKPSTALTGLGPGGADAAADAVFAATGLPLNFAGAPKLLLEYGVPAALLFAAFAYLAIVRRAPSPTLAVGGLFANSLLFAGLLQPQVLYVLLPLSAFFTGTRFEGRGGEPARLADGDVVAEVGPAVPGDGSGRLLPTLPAASPDGGLGSRPVVGA
ncbi:hypothetical protein [Kineococcus glutinatus]|uniref:O-antigen ligase n=1 Tax=Kineococcus glutinatus TaxID=1070872 RepID=A0ABP8VBS1_9ACTN